MSTIRSRRGSALTELGPALFVLLVLIFFPMMDVIGACCGYALAYLVHGAEVRQLSVEKPDVTQTAIVATNADLQTINSMPGFAGFCGVNVGNVGTRITHNISYQNNDPANPTNITDVAVSTTVTVTPFLTIPFIPNMPGLSAPIPFTIASTASQEEKGLNGQ